MKHRVGWTGGFDSTFHVLDLLDRGETVEAHYLGMDRSWRKEVHEKEARLRIVAALPAEMRNRLDLVEPMETWDAQAVETFRKLHEEHEEESFDRMEQGISGQIPALAAWLQTLGHGMELIYVADDFREPHGDYHRFALRWLERFGANLPKVDRRKASFLDGRFDDLLGETWSCNGLDDLAEPCGRCGSCQSRIIP